MEVEVEVQFLNKVSSFEESDIIPIPNLTSMGTLSIVVG